MLIPLLCFPSDCSVSQSYVTGHMHAPGRYFECRSSLVIKESSRLGRWLSLQRLVFLAGSSD